MPQATIQITQGLNIGGDGQSVLGLVTGVSVILTDAAGGGATSWAWTIISWPAPLSSPPTVNNSSLQVANATPTLDGVYLVHLIRTDPGPVVTTDTRFFGIGDTDYGIVLPSAGMTGAMTNIGGSAAAQRTGWEGGADGGANVFLDFLFRFLRSRVGRFIGLEQTVNFTSSSPSTVTITDDVDKPWRTLNLTGTGLYSEQIDSTGVPTGKRFKYKINLTTGSGGFALLNGIAGPTILALVAPPNGTVSYEVETAFDGTNWQVLRVGTPDPLGLPKFKEFNGVSGLQSTSQTVATRIGSFRLDPSKFPANAQITFQVAVDTTAPQLTVQLYNLTDSGIVAGSVLTSTSTTTAFLTSGALTLPSALKDYEVQLFMDSGAPTDHVECTSAKVILTWG